jgi:hypothetical protein
MLTNASKSHLARARWMTREEYPHLLRRGWPRRERSAGLDSDPAHCAGQED